MADDDRINFSFAVQEIGHRLGLSPGAAQAELRELCANGVVRSWKRPYSIVEGEAEDMGPLERVLPSEWKSREVDLGTDVDGYKNFVDVSKADLEQQIDLKQQIDLEQQIGQGQEQSPCDAEIIRLLKEGNRPGKNIGWKAFCDDVRKGCNWRGESGFSDETIERRTRALQKKVGQIG